MAKCTVCEKELEATEYFTGACPNCFKVLSDAQKLLLSIAMKLCQRGHDYYNKDDKGKTAIFWEIESIIKDRVKIAVSGVGDKTKEKQ